MDSEHRHELKSNELADFLKNFPQYCKDNSNIILGVGLILVALITWPLFNKMGRNKAVAQQSQVSDAIQKLNQTINDALRASNDPQALDAVSVSAQTLMDDTAKTDNPNLAALAYIKAAQAIRTGLHIKKENLTAAAIESDTQKAQEAYEKALKMAETPTIKAMAQLGLALCAEERGQTQQAADIYQTIVDDESYAATVFPKQAQLRLDAIDENAESFIFAPTPEEAATLANEKIQAAIEAKQAEIAETKKQIVETEAKLKEVTDED